MTFYLKRKINIFNSDELKLKLFMMSNTYLVLKFRGRYNSASSARLRANCIRIKMRVFLQIEVALSLLSDFGMKPSCILLENSLEFMLLPCQINQYAKNK